VEKTAEEIHEKTGLTNLKFNYENTSIHTDVDHTELFNALFASEFHV
jgi:hypothetical protein